MKKSYPVIFMPELEGYSVVFPDFSGGTQGDNFEEAMSNAKEFLDGMLAYYIDEDLILPKATEFSSLSTKNQKDIISFIQGDPSPYIQKKTVRKNVTVPEWLATRGEKDKVNFSEILTEALIERYG
ncbi:type II toxin-antitoxin system HicB family antitoxin [Enterococcus olivae]